MHSDHIQENDKTNRFSRKQEIKYMVLDIGKCNFCLERGYRHCDLEANPLRLYRHKCISKQNKRPMGQIAYVDNSSLYHYILKILSMKLFKIIVIYMWLYSKIWHYI